MAASFCIRRTLPAGTGRRGWYASSPTAASLPPSRVLPARIAEDWFGAVAGTAAGFAVSRGGLSFPLREASTLIVPNYPFAVVFLSREILVQRFAEEFGPHADLYCPFRISD